MNSLFMLSASGTTERIAGWVAMIVLYAIPLLYGTVGEIITEKSGSLNLGVEGTMALGGIGGYILASMADNLYVGVLGSFLVGSLVGLLFAFMTVTLKANQNVTGLTITTFGVGLFFFLGNSMQTSGEWMPMIKLPHLKEQMSAVDFGALSDIPFIGEAFFSHNPLVYIGIAIAIITGVYLKRTKPGLKLRAIGENPAAADSVGVGVNRSKYIHIMIGSGIMGLGGLFMGTAFKLGVFDVGGWTAGYGWISIALVIFVSWKPALAILGTMLFAFFNTLTSTPLPSLAPEAFGWMLKVPIDFYKALPFVVTAIVLIVTSMRKKNKQSAPAALGLNYYREDR